VGVTLSSSMVRFAKLYAAAFGFSSSSLMDGWVIAAAGLLKPEVMKRLPASSIRGLMLDPPEDNTLVSAASELAELGWPTAGFIAPFELGGAPFSINSE